MISERSRFDFAFIPGGPYQETVEFVQLGEQLGYRCAWLPDQTFHRDPFVLLGLCAQATQNIGLGLGITSPFTRLPVQIARAAGVVDEVADGRFRLGLGTANAHSVLAPLGIELKRSVSRLRDAVIIIRRLLAGETVDFEGRDDRLKGVKLDFTPIRPDIQIYLGTRGPKTMELAGEVADGVLAESLYHAGGLPYVRECIQLGAERVQRASPEVDLVSWQLVQVTDDVQTALAALKPWVAYSIRVGPPDAMLRIGIDEQVIREVSEAMEKGDRDKAAARVTDDAVKCMMIVGTPEQVTEQISQVFDRGANAVNLLLLGTKDSMYSTLTRFAREVMPAFQENAL